MRRQFLSEWGHAVYRPVTARRKNWFRPMPGQLPEHKQLLPSCRAPRSAQMAASAATRSTARSGGLGNVALGGGAYATSGSRLSVPRALAALQRGIVGALAAVSSKV
jgi:hypothetical protein